MPKPSPEDRLLVLKRYIGEHNNLTETEWNMMVQETDGMSARDIKGLIVLAKSKIEEVCRKAQYVKFVTIQGEPMYVACHEDEDNSQSKGNLTLEHMYQPMLKYTDVSPRILHGEPGPQPERKRSSGWRRKLQLTEEERSDDVKDTNEMTEERYLEWKRKNP